MPDPADFLPLSAVEFHILAAMARGPRHGYGIMQDVEARSSGSVILRPGTLYGALKRMLQDVLVRETDAPHEAESEAERRRYYVLTGPGTRGAARRCPAPRGAGALRASRSDSPAETHVTTARRWYGLVLRRFPPAFRDRFSIEVLDLIEEQRGRLGAPGLAALAAFHLATTLHLVAALVRERELLVRRASGTILWVAAGAHTAYDLANPALAMGIPAWGLTVIALAAGALLFARPTRYRSAG